MRSVRPFHSSGPCHGHSVGTCPVVIQVIIGCRELMLVHRRTERSAVRVSRYCTGSCGQLNRELVLADADTGDSSGDAEINSPSFVLKLMPSSGGMGGGGIERVSACQNLLRANLRWTLARRAVL
ncbi:hypothetical protein PoB_000231200 [Plakobranchus ocellatus]|uniref:Uncharacterized protein n=1 Tax=Plakobranchus ocellatus TaxID=259542 RepID=A0AAV3Y050_9GAST|nr:hypothetical protein PoB_000231200 [Plakobranchus ocellatus]